MSKLTQQMQKDWNRRAKRDALHYVLNRHPLDTWDLEEWLASGEAGVRQTIDTLSITPDELTCLEIGCGAGRMTGALAQRFQQVIALDISGEMIKQAKENAPNDNITFIKGTGENLEGIEDNSIDVAFSIIVFQHIPDPEIQYQYLREIGRVLVSGGWFYLHFYADQQHTEHIAEQWRIRAEAGDVLGWSEAARVELEKEAYKTCMQTAVDTGTVLGILADMDFNVVRNEGQDTSAWVLVGFNE